MNKDYKNKIIIWGQYFEYDYLCSDTARDLLEEAYEKANYTSEPDIECILDILNNLSKAWSDPNYPLRKKAKELLINITSFSSGMIDEGLNRISLICSPDRLIKKINNELGDINILNEGRIGNSVAASHIRARGERKDVCPIHTFLIYLFNG